jgi:5-methylcytosine-specific restriction protein A
VWTREETLLALDLYLQLDGRFPSKSDPRVIELSDLLRQMPYHRDQAKKPSFRNPDGVAFKLLNLRNVATGKGLSNVSAMDRRIWSEYGARADRVKELARQIRLGLDRNAASAEDNNSGDDDDIEFEEG